MGVRHRMARPLVVLSLAVTLLTGSWALKESLYKKPFQRTPGSTSPLPHGAPPKRPYPYNYNPGFFSPILYHSGGQRFAAPIRRYSETNYQSGYQKRKDLYTNTISQVPVPTSTNLYKKYSFKVLNTNVAPSRFSSTIYKSTPTPVIKTFQQPFFSKPKAEKLVLTEPAEPRNNAIEDSSQEDNTVLDFSSGSAEIKESTVSKVNKTDPNLGARGFSMFQDSIILAGLEGFYDGINVTLFSPDNKAFEASNFNSKSVPKSELRKIMLRHIVKGTIKLKDLKAGPLETIGGEFIQIKKFEPSGIGIVRDSGDIRVKFGDIESEFGLIHIIESVIV